jgi:hypothetical protein
MRLPLMVLLVSMAVVSCGGQDESPGAAADEHAELRADPVALAASGAKLDMKKAHAGLPAALPSSGVDVTAEQSATDGSLGETGAGSPSAETDEECDFDQEAQIKENILLKEKYRGSHLAEDGRVVVVPVPEGEVRIGIGGCVHYGVTVELRTSNPNQQLTESEFMEQILYLAKTYSQGHIDHARLSEVIKNKDWQRDDDAAISKSYSIHYDELSTFEAYEENDDQHKTVGFTNYL